jgi:hypothetical protein
MKNLIMKNLMKTHLVIQNFEVMDEIHSTEEKKDVEEYSTDEEIKTDTSKVSEKKLKKKEAVEKSGIYFYIHF